MNPVKGEYKHSIDAKGRLAMPARLREELGERFTVTKGLDGCLAVYPEKEWEALEDRILLNPTHAVFRQVNGLRRDLLQARRAIWPLRDALLRLQQGDSGLLSQETMTYLRDAQSHVMQVIETLELLREMVSGLHDVYLTALNTRMNDIMKVLTIISTIFIPLTFLAGIYGMNFEHQPEYGWRWAYPALWGLMLVLVGFMLYLFRRKRWI